MDKRKFIKEYVEPIVIAILIALFIRAFVVQAFKIPSSSMEPTLHVGDHILVSKFIYGIRVPFTDIKLFQFKKPQRGDIVVFIYPRDRSKDFIKRVIATEGEKVEIIRNKIYINEKLIEDPWGFYEKSDVTKMFPSAERYGPSFVPKGSLFVLGDNRENSQDSRFWGFAETRDVKGKAFIVYFSGSSLLNIMLPWKWDEINWFRFGKLIR